MSRSVSNGRLQIPRSITPSPQDILISRKMIDFCSPCTAPKFSLSGRDDHTRDFARVNTFTPAGPNTYNTSREMIDRLSTSKPTQTQYFKQRINLEKTGTYGPGPGKYNTGDSCLSYVLPLAPRWSFGSKSVERKQKAYADTPSPIDYNIRRAKSNIGFKYSLR